MLKVTSTREGQISDEVTSRPFHIHVENCHTGRSLTSGAVHDTHTAQGRTELEDRSGPPELRPRRPRHAPPAGSSEARGRHSARARGL